MEMVMQRTTKINWVDELAFWLKASLIGLAGVAVLMILLAIVANLH